MDNGNVVQQDSVLHRIESLAPGLQERWPKPTVWLAAEILGALCVGLVFGKVLFGGASAPAGITPDLARGQWVRAVSGGFEMFLPKGWENFTAEANVGVGSDSQREIVFRQKSGEGTRLLVLQRANAKRAGGDKVDAAMATWMSAQRHEMSKLRQQMGPASPDVAAGVPVLTYHWVKPGVGSDVMAGTLVYRGAFYSFSYATPHPGDTELLLSLLGSIREFKGVAIVPHKPSAKPAAAKAAPKPAARKDAGKPKKK